MLKMQQLQHEQQQPIVSEQFKQKSKVQNYKQYLVNSGCVMHFIKFLLGVRKKQIVDDSVPSDEVLKMFYDYIGAVEVDTTQFDKLKQEVNRQKEQRTKIKGEIQLIKKQIEEKKIAKQKAEEEKRLKQQEQAAKNVKKGGKK